MTAKTGLFSVDDLAAFERPGATIKPREGHRYAGCWVEFENGWTVSIQWGNGNYSDNHDRDFQLEPQDSTTAEIAVWKGGSDMLRWRTDEGDTVQGYCSMERVQRVLDLAAEDKLARSYQPPTPPPEMVADDDWTD